MVSQFVCLFSQPEGRFFRINPSSGRHELAVAQHLAGNRRYSEGAS